MTALNLPTDNPVILGVIFVAYWIMALDGMRFVFRGARDHMIGLGSSRLLARVGAAIAAIALFYSGAAPLVTLAGWLGGIRPLRARSYGTDTTATR